MGWNVVVESWVLFSCFLFGGGQEECDPPRLPRKQPGKQQHRTFLKSNVLHAWDDKQRQRSGRALVLRLSLPIRFDSLLQDQPASRGYHAFLHVYIVGSSWPLFQAIRLTFVRHTYNPCPRDDGRHDRCKCINNDQVA